MHSQNKQNVGFSEEKKRIVTGTEGKTWKFSAKMDILVEKVNIFHI